MVRGGRGQSGLAALRPALLAPLCALALACAALVAWKLGAFGTAGDSLSELDRALLEWVHRHRGPGVATFFSGLTLLGKWPMLVAAMGLALALVPRPRAWLLLPLLVTYGGTQLSVHATKLAVRHPRPDPSLAHLLEESFSFPSGHAAGSLAVHGFLAYAWVRSGRAPARVAIACAATLVGAIGASRVILGVHYPADVLAGYLLGGAWLVAGLAWAESRRAEAAPAR